MTTNELKIILARGEDLHNEFKKAEEKVPVKFYDTVVPFLNREGGTIVLGADDEGNILGVNENAVEQMKKDIITALNNKDVNSILGKERAQAFIELVDMEKSRLNEKNLVAVENLELEPELVEIENLDEFFYKQEVSWSEKGGKLKKCRILIHNELKIDDIKKRASYAEKGVKLFDKRTITIFRLILICLKARKRDDVFEILEINSRDKFCELYMNPLRANGLIEYTIKEKPNSPNQRYITTAKGRQFLGGFEE
jgi:predicted transcriptional regulator